MAVVPSSAEADRPSVPADIVVVHRAIAVGKQVGRMVVAGDTVAVVAARKLAVVDIGYRVAAVNSQAVRKLVVECTVGIDCMVVAVNSLVGCIGKDGFVVGE